MVSARGGIVERSIPSSLRIVASGICLAVALGYPGAARATPAKAQKGKVVWPVMSWRGMLGQNAVTDPHRVFCGIELSYAFWTLLDEPVEEYLIKLRPCSLLQQPAWVASSGLRVDRTWLKKNEPDLVGQIQATAPLDIILEASVTFAKRGTSFAKGRLYISPDLIEPPGKAQEFAVPGSPDWDSWFEEVRCFRHCTLGPDATVGEQLRAAWATADEVEVTDIQPVFIEWPEAPFDRLAQVADQRRDDTADSAFWSTPTYGGSARGAPVDSVAATSGGKVAKKKGRRAKNPGRLAKAHPSAAAVASSFALSIDPSSVTRVAVNGKLVPIVNGQVALMSGEQAVIVHTQNGQFRAQVSCEEAERRRLDRPGCVWICCIPGQPEDVDNPACFEKVRQCSVGNWTYLGGAP